MLIIALSLFGGYVSPIEVGVVGLLVMSVGVGVGVFLSKRSASKPWWDRLVVGVLPLFIMCLLIGFAARIAQLPYDWVHSMRLSFIFSPMYGHDPYPAADQGPIVVSMYPPLFLVLFSPTTWFSSPTSTMIAGGVIAFLCFSLPVIGIHTSIARRHKAPVAGVLAATTFFAMTLSTFGFRYCAVSPAPDGAALGLGLLACWPLYRATELTTRRLWLSAFLAACCLWTKQTMVPLVPALWVYVMLQGGLKPTIRYTIALAVFGIATATVMVIAFGPFDELYYQLVGLPGQMPWRPFSGEIAGIILRVWAMPVMVFVVVMFLASRNGSNKHHSQSKFTERNPWSLFAIVALFLAPLSIPALLKIGGDDNVLCPPMFFLMLAATTTVISILASTEHPSRKPTALVGTALILVLLISLVPDGHQGVLSFRSLGHNRTDKIYEFIKANPEQAYFPHWPHVQAMAEGRMLHSGTYTAEIRNTGIDIPPEMLNEHLPGNMRYLIYTDGDNMVYRQLLTEWFADFDTRIELDAFPPTWMIYVRWDDPLAKSASKSPPGSN